MTAGDGVVVALDQGSHSSRALLFDAAGAPIAQAQVTVATRREGDDVVEQEPDELVSSLVTAIQDACETADCGPLTLTAAGLATQRSTIVCWERASGRALTPALSWQDRRNDRWLARLRPFAGRVRAITGLPLSPHYGASKLRWCLDHVPAVARAAAAGGLAAGPLSSFLLASMLEERSCVVDPANASRTLLYDPAALDWSDEMLAMFELGRSLLPHCVPTRHPFGRLVAGSRSVPLVACTGDQSAAAFAFGRPDAASALVNVGTGAFVQRVAPDGAALPGGLLRSVLYADAAGVLHCHEGTVNGAGSALEWLSEHGALDVDRALAALPEALPAPDIPLFMNGVGGLGAPFWKPDFQTSFIGAGDDRACLVAVLESIAFLLQENLAALQRSAPLRRIRISGGLARSAYLCRCLASVSGLSVERYALDEATARGVAFLAAGEPASWRPVPVERVFEPMRDEALVSRHARWRAEMARRGAVAPV